MKLKSLGERIVRNRLKASNLTPARREETQRELASLRSTQSPPAVLRVGTSHAAERSASATTRDDMNTDQNSVPKASHDTMMNRIRANRAESQPATRQSARAMTPTERDVEKRERLRVLLAAAPRPISAAPIPLVTLETASDERIPSPSHQSMIDRIRQNRGVK